MWREILGLENKRINNLVDVLTPKRSFSDVVLPDDTREQLYQALTQIEKHRLIFSTWGLGDRHPTGLGLVFNFAGPPGTGKSICAEAVATTLGRKMMRVSYSELESVWVGETGKNIKALFREARAQDMVLFFDEADAMAARRFSNVFSGHEREANLAVNILLKELEEHPGVVIFATNMAANFDPAFERRIRLHVLFRMPSVPERERIWKVQVHPHKTPLGSDVNFRELAERYEVTGGNIRNAVLRAAQIAAAEDGPDETKRILHRHFVTAMEQVLSASKVMQQNIQEPTALAPAWREAVEAAENRLRTLEDDLQACRTELELVGESQAVLARKVDEQAGAVGQEIEARAAALREEVVALREELGRLAESQSSALQVWKGEQESTQKELVASLQSRLEAQLARVTLIPLPKAATLALALLVIVGLVLGGRYAW